MSKNLRIEQVAMAVGVSVETINGWYRWARKFPDNEYAKMLPVYEQERPTAPRFWAESDIFKFMEFQKSIPKGRSGIIKTMLRKEKEENHGNKSDDRKTARNKTSFGKV